MEQIHEYSTEQLRDLIGTYPHVPLYRSLLARTLKTEGSDEFSSALRQAALHAPDRVRLYELLHHGEEVLQDVTEQVDGIRDDAAEPAKEERENVAQKEREEEVAAQTIAASDRDEAVQADEMAEDPVIEVSESRSVVTDPADLSGELVRSAAEKGITLDEKHTFLEWLEILEGGLAGKSGKSDPLQKEMERNIASTAYEADLREEAKQLEADEDVEDKLSAPQRKAVQELADKSIALSTGLVTETLAKLLLMQGKITEAIATYEALRLKYPEKSDYFAAQIQQIKTSK